MRRRKQEEKLKKRKQSATAEVAESTNGVDDGKEVNMFTAGLQIDSENEFEEINTEDLLDDDAVENLTDLDDEDDYDDMEELEGDESEEEPTDVDDDDDDDDDDDQDDLESSESEWEGIASGEEITDVDELTASNTDRNAKQPPTNKAILKSDLVAFVLDARAPNVTRSLETEKLADTKGKTSIFILNRAGTLHK